MKCLTCHVGGRSGNQPARGAELRGRGEGYLNGCGCPEDPALTELFLTKIVAGDSEVPQRLFQGSKVIFDNKTIPQADFALNSTNLARIQGMIYHISGLTIDTMFTTKLKRTKTSAIWALEKLTGLVEAEKAEMIEEMIAKLEAM